MKRILLFILLFSFATSLSAQEDNADYSIGGDQYFSYEEETRPFRLLDTPLIQLGIYAASTPFFKQQSFWVWYGWAAMDYKQFCYRDFFYGYRPAYYTRFWLYYR